MKRIASEAICTLDSLLSFPYFFAGSCRDVRKLSSVITAKAFGIS